MGRLRRLLFIVAAALVLPAPALACSILPPPPPPAPPPGVSEADAAALVRAWSEAQQVKFELGMREQRLRRQANLFDDAGTILLVRFDRKVMSGEEEKAVLQPIGWLKGASPARELVLERGLQPPCSAIIAHEAYYGSPGEVFVVFLKETGGAARTVLEAFAVEGLIEPRLVAGLTTAPQ